MNGPGSDPSAPASPERLDSWKEVASYLRRDESTVRRWEKTEGLPVHRHVHDQRASVFAYRHELDAWLEGRGVAEAHASGTEATSETPVLQDGSARQPWARRWTAMGLIAAAISLLAWLGSQPLAPASQTETYRILIADPVRPGAGPLRQMLEQHIADVPDIAGVPRTEIDESLRLMRRAPGSPIDQATGQEIALRRGDVDGLLLWEPNEREGAAQVVLSLRDPTDGRLIAGWHSTMAAGAVPADEAFAERVVRGAATALRSRSRPGNPALAFSGMEGMRLEDATTSSTKAWRLYAEAMTLHFAFQWRQSAELLERAIAEDPDFATAHAFLGRAYTSLGEAERADSSYRRAFELADTVTDRERYFIRASYFEHVIRDPQRTSDAYSTLLVRYPDHYWGVTYASWFHFRYGGSGSVTRYFKSYADARPNHLGMVMQAAFALGAWANSPHLAERYVARARSLMPELAVEPLDSIERMGTGSDAWMLFHEVYASWNRSDLEGALERLQELERRTHPRFAPWLGRAYLALGRLQDAERVFTGIPLDNVHRHEGLLGVALARDDGPALRRHLADIGPRSIDWIAVLRVRENLYSPDESLLTRDPLSPGARSVLGAVTLREGHADEAIAILEAGLPRLREWAEEQYYLALESLARAWQQKGDPARAAETLEVTRNMRAQAAFGARYRPLLWMRTQAHLAGIYRELGRNGDADAIELELAGLLAVADSDHSLVADGQGDPHASSD